MTELIAKPIVKNKMWIVESAGTKVGNIMTVDEGGVVYVHDNKREIFPSIKILQKTHNVVFTRADRKKSSEAIACDVYGFPTDSTPHNQVLDVQRYLPIYTKGVKSKSFYCAGHYIVRFNTTWVNAYCPKLITLNRYEYQGPFKAEESMLLAMREANGQ
jgi:hypothetical protein